MSDITSSPESAAPNSVAESDSVERFASDLRLLRVAAGSPTLAHLHHETGLSRTVISEAFTGKQLPSARTLDGIVRACDGDPVEWIRRRDALVPKGTTPSGDASSEVDADQSATPSRLVPRRSVAIFAIAALVVGAVGGAVVTRAVVDPQISSLQAQLKAAGPLNPHAQIQVKTGVDPAMTPCVNDAKVAASEDRTNDTRIQIVWSNKCYAGWARIARYDGKENGNEVKVAIYEDTAPDGPDRQETTEPGVQGAYTTLIVRPSPETRLCAVGSITLDGKDISLGAPICT